MAEFTEVMKQKERLCRSMKDCTQCVMSCDYNGIGCNCIEFFRLHPKDAEAIIMKWAKEHPVMTNADKFEEVFGFKFLLSSSNNCDVLKCPSLNQDCNKCINKDFWSKEYKDPENK